MTRAGKTLEQKIALEVTRQIKPLREILERLQAEAAHSASAAPEAPAGPELIRQMTQDSETRLKKMNADVGARIADLDARIAHKQRRIAARLNQPQPKGDSHV